MLAVQRLNLAIGYIPVWSIWGWKRWPTKHLKEETMAPTPRTMRWMAPFGVLAYLFLAGAGFSLQVLAQSQFGSFSIAVQAPFYLLVGVWVAIGALIVWHHPENRIGWLLSLVMPLVALDLVAFGFVTYEATTDATSLLGAAALVWLKVTGMPFGMLIFAITLLLFPNVRFLSPRWRLAAWVAVVSFLAYSPLKALEPGPLILVPYLLVPDASSPLAVSEARWALLRPLMELALLSLTLAMVAGLVSLLVRFRRTYGEERQQIKWLIAPAFLFLLGVPVLVYGEYASSQAIFALGSGMHMLAVTGLMVGMAIAIFKYRLYDIDIIINRTLVYGVLTVSVVVIYVLIVGGMGVLFRSGGNLILALLATGVVAVLSQPLRERVQRAVNRLMYGERDDPATVFARLGELLEASASPQETLPGLVRTIAQTLKLTYTAIELGKEGDREIAAAYGKPSGEIERFALVYQLEEVGSLVVAPRSRGEELTQADRRLIENIARQAGAVAQAVRLTNELQRSRLRLVTAREEERRRLRRDLHDELGPQLASQALIIEALEKRLHKDPTSAARLLEELKKQSRRAMQDIRQIVYGLRPPALDQLGLVGAVKEALAAHQRSGVSFHLQAKEKMPSLPAAVEVAIYHIIQEAATNVIRHARAKDCMVRIDYKDLEEDAEVRLTVEDDGLGLQEDSRNGVGLHSMRERADELGGIFKIVLKPDGGTQISVLFPITRDAP
jgi:signal transduction histidine kinase